MAPTTSPPRSAQPRPNKLTPQQRIALQGLALRCQPEQTYEHCVDEVSGWLGVRSTRVDVLLDAGLRNLYGSDDVRRACRVFLEQVNAKPEIIRRFTVDGMSFDDRLRAFRVETQGYLIALGRLSPAPTKFWVAAQRVAEIAERGLFSVRESMALALAVFFPDITSLDERTIAFHKAAHERFGRGEVEGAEGGREGVAEKDNAATEDGASDMSTAESADAHTPLNSAAPQGEHGVPRGRTLQRRYDLMSDRDKAKTYDLAVWAVRGVAMPMPAAEAGRLFRLLFPDIRNATQHPHLLRVAVEQRRLVVKDKRHQVAFLVNDD